jgi:hypothetical protein
MERGDYTMRQHNRATARTHGKQLTDAELDAEFVVELPDREAMSTIEGPLGVDGNVAIPINEAQAANVNSDYSVAIADADQFVIVDQADTDTDASSDDEPPHDRGRGWRRR